MRASPQMGSPRREERQALLGSRNGHTEMTLSDALVALDRAATEASESSAHQTQRQQLWTETADAIERFSLGQEVYSLSDGGNSQVAYEITHRWCRLVQNPTALIRDGFERALLERRAIEKLVAEWLDGGYHDA